MTDQEFQTRHFSLAAFLLYILGPEAHLATIKKLDRGCSFVFADDGTCRQSADVFFSEEGAAVGNAFQLLECGRELKRTIAEALASPNGIWQRE